MKASTKNLLFLHIGILGISTSGVFGRSLEMPVPLAIAWRAIAALAFLIPLMFILRTSFQVQKKHVPRLLFSGLFMAAHWLTYFYSLYYSNIPIAMLSIFTYPIMTVILEPILLKTSFDKNLIICAIIMLIGLFFLTPEFNLENNYTIGIIFGVTSALAYTFRNLIVKSLINEYDATNLMTHQIMWAMVLTIPILFMYDQPTPTGYDWWYIAGLGLVTTAIGHTLFARSFKMISLSTASIISMIQPLYGIGLGILFLSEIPDSRTAIGGAIILLGLVVQNILKRTKPKPETT